MVGMVAWLVLFSAGQSASFAQNKEPSYQGRSLSYWLAELKVENKDEYQWHRRLAVDALVAIGHPAVPALKELLHDKDGAVRQWATATLGQIQPLTRDTIKALIGALDDDEDRVRAVALLVILDVGPPAKDAVPALVRILQSEKPWNNYRAAEALGEIGQEAKAAVSVLTATLKDRDQAMVARAAGALCRIEPQNKEPLSVLTSLLESGKDSTARATAAIALGKVGAAAKPAIPGLINALHDPAANVRLTAAIAYQRIDKQSKTAIDGLIGMLKEKDQFLAGVAADAIADAKLASPEVLQALGNALKANNSLSVHAAEALWKLKPGNGVTLPSLTQALESKDLLVRLGSAEVLGRMRRDARVAVPGLLRALRDENESVRQVAWEALQKVDPDAAAKARTPKGP